MKLVFFSGGDNKDNSQLDNVFINLIKKKDPTVSFIFQNMILKITLKDILSLTSQNLFISQLILNLIRYF